MGCRPRVLIVGGGIGGLSAALAMAGRGWSVRLFEQAPDLNEVGAGIQISPNGVKVLQALGLWPWLAPKAFEPEAVEIRFGKPPYTHLLHMPMKGPALKRWGAPFLSFHRADLIEALVKAIEDFNQKHSHDSEGAPLIQIKRACRVTAYEQGQKHEAAEGQSPSFVSVKLEDGSIAHGDFLIGADGLHSILRHVAFGHGPRRYTGQMAWRALIAASDLGAHKPPPVTSIWVGPGQHAVLTLVRGGDLVNFVGVIERPWQAVEALGLKPDEEDWDQSGLRKQAQDDFAGWAPTIQTLMARAPCVTFWPLFDRPALPRWHDGRMILIGDAAHPMLPSLAQAGGQALEDAWLLAQHLSPKRLQGGLTITQACQAFQNQRMTRVEKVQRQSAQNASLFHAQGFLKQCATYGSMWLGSRMAMPLIYRRNDWLYAYDPIKTSISKDL